MVLCSCAICLCSGIEGLDGIAALGGLRELFLSHNRVADTTPLAMHDHLEVRSLSTTFIYFQICIAIHIPIHIDRPGGDGIYEISHQRWMMACSVLDLSLN